MSSRPSGREPSARDADSSPPQIPCRHEEERTERRAGLEVGAPASAPESAPTLAQQKEGFLVQNLQEGGSSPEVVGGGPGWPLSLDKLDRLSSRAAGVSGSLGLFRCDLDTHKSSLFLGLLSYLINIFNKDQLLVHRIFCLCLGRD